MEPCMCTRRPGGRSTMGTWHSWQRLGLCTAIAQVTAHTSGSAASPHGDCSSAQALQQPWAWMHRLAAHLGQVGPCVGLLQHAGHELSQRAQQGAHQLAAQGAAGVRVPLGRRPEVAALLQGQQRRLRLRSAAFQARPTLLRPYRGRPGQLTGRFQACAETRCAPAGLRVCPGPQDLPRQRISQCISLPAGRQACRAQGQQQACVRMHTHAGAPAA